MAPSPFPRALLLVVAASVLMRLLLQPIAAGLSLTSRYELSSPMTSSSRLSEGVYLMSTQQDLYSTDLVHFPPWFILLSRVVLPLDLSSLPQFGLLIMYAFADAAAVLAISFIHLALRGTPPPSLTVIKLCFNPLAIVSCLALTSSSLYHAIVFVSVALAGAAQVPMIPSLFLLAAASSLDFRAVTFLPVLLAMRSRVTATTAGSSSSFKVRKAIVYVTSFVLCTVVLLVIDVYILAAPLSPTQSSFFARVEAGASAIGQAVQMFDLQVRELVPSIGTAWYMMME